DEIRKVHYPGLPSHPDHALAKKLLDGFGGLMSIELTRGAEAADRFVRKLKMISHASSFGGIDTLVIEPRFSSHAHMTSEERAAIGIPDGFLRLSIGIENADDIIADIAQALQCQSMIGLHEGEKEDMGQRVALSHVTCQVKRGEFVFLIGPSGS